ncbi:hypothetical protein KC330_g8997 [Hortaea werneckii]|nr:hypothetical protein KC330_g8997 [Hortaea werneckii]
MERCDSNENSPGYFTMPQNSIFGQPRQSDSRTLNLEGERNEYTQKYERIKTVYQRLKNAQTRLNTAHGELESRHMTCDQYIRHLRSGNNDLSVSLGRRSDAIEQLQRDLRESNFKNEQLRNLYQLAATDTKTAEQPSLPAATRTQENHGLEKRCQALQKAYQMAEAQAKMFKHELLLFKKSAAASAKVTNQLGDDDIRKEFDNVFYALQDFALSTLNRLSDTAKDWSSSYIRDPSNMSREYAPQNMLILLSRIVVCLFEPEHLFGVPQEALGTAAKELAAKMIDTPVAKAWLDLTRKVLEIDHEAVMDADEMLVEMAVNHTVEMLQYRDLHCCKAIFKLRMITCRSSEGSSIFETTTMEAIASNENEGSFTSRPIELSVFPGIYKYGNEMCHDQHQMTVICRARAIPQKIKRKQAQLEEDVPNKIARIKQEPL